MELDQLLAHVLDRQQAAFKAQLEQHYSVLAKVVHQVRQTHQVCPVQYQNGEQGVNGNAWLAGHLSASRQPVPEGNDSHRRPRGAMQRQTSCHSDAGRTQTGQPFRMIPTATSAPCEEVQSVLVTGNSSVSSGSGSPKLRRQGTTATLDDARRYKSKIRSLVGSEYNLEARSIRGKVLVLLNGHISSFVGVCICLNTVTMFLQTLWSGREANESLGVRDYHLPPADLVFDIIEYTLCMVFITELALQLYVARCHFFSNMANIMDMVIVLITTVEVFILTPMASNIGNVSFIRMLRLTKFVRALRVVRTLRSFEGLRVLIATVIHSFASMIWAMLVLLIFQLMLAIFLCQSLSHFVLDEANDIETRFWVNRHYGDGFKSLYTVFELTFSGCWPNYSRPIIEGVSAHYAAIFVVYIVFVVFAMIRVISALFLKETLNQAARDADMMVRERSKKSSALKKELSELFDEADTSRDGVLSKEELAEVMSHPKVCLWLDELGIEVSDTSDLFELLDDGDGSITVEEFVNGISRLKGEARAKDLIKIMGVVHRILGHCKGTRWLVEDILAKVNDVHNVWFSDNLGEAFPVLHSGAFAGNSGGEFPAHIGGDIFEV